MGRVDISMTAVEVEGFLSSCSQLVIGTIDGEGWPTATIAASSFAQGLLALTFAAGDPLAAHLGDDPRVCCLADEHDSYYGIRGVVVHGRAGPQMPAGSVEVEIDRVISFDFGRLGQ